MKWHQYIWDLFRLCQKFKSHYEWLQLLSDFLILSHWSARTCEAWLRSAERFELCQDYLRSTESIKTLQTRTIGVYSLKKKLRPIQSPNETRTFDSPVWQFNCLSFCLFSCLPPDFYSLPLTAYLLAGSGITICRAVSLDPRIKICPAFFQTFQRNRHTCRLSFQYFLWKEAW